MEIAPSTLDNLTPALAAAHHPVCRSTDVPDGGVTKVTLLGEDWVVARIDGRLTALADRCPHRGSPLHLGCVVEGTVQCAYHGYRFDADGRCTLIPALGVGATVPPKAHTRAAASVVERYGLVWLSPEPPIVPMLDVPEWDDPDFVVAPLPDLVWHAGAAQMVDNFLDLTHFPFVHTDTFGDPDDLEVPHYDVVRDGLGFTCDYVHSTKLLQDSFGAAEFEVAPRRSIWWYAAPFSIRLRIEYPAENVVLTILFFHQPVDAVTTKLYAFDLRNDIADGRTTVEDTVAFQLAVATEDKVLLEQMVSKAVPLDLSAEVHTRADKITLEMRRVLADFVVAAGAR
ncbi:MAG: aromatic ring-hydroxylating dioxygenase subunit alpha [Acidimicrobiales bacterium]